MYICVWAIDDFVQRSAGYMVIRSCSPSICEDKVQYTVVSPV